MEDQESGQGRGYSRPDGTRGRRGCANGQTLGEKSGKKSGRVDRLVARDALGVPDATAG